MDNFLLEELDYFIESSVGNPELREKHAKHWQIYKEDAEHQIDDLRFLSSYRPGTYDLEFQGSMFDVGIAERNGARYYIFYNDQDFESLEISLILFMVAGAFLVIWAATAYGLWFSKRVLKPVMTLSDEVREIDLETTGTIDVRGYAEDEVGFLASEFDSHVNRIKKLVQREREFTANASHELRTPLTIIKTANEAMLLRTNLPEDIKPRLLRIQRAANEMSNRLEALLVLSREPEKATLLSDQTPLPGLLERLLEDYEDLCPPSVRIIKRFNSQPLISAPEAMLSIVLGNLIKNAFNNTREGSITIEIDECQLSISDTGKGIPPHLLPDVFKRGSKDQNSNGLGLGLSIVQRICDHYQWQITINSACRQGTTITLNFKK